jgi:hypothetical protein
LLCTIVDPLHSRLAERFGASISEAIM